MSGDRYYVPPPLFEVRDRNTGGPVARCWTKDDAEQTARALNAALTQSNQTQEQEAHNV